MDDKLEAFLDDISRVCKKHQLSIGHEDLQGSFIIYNYDPYYTKWLREADNEIKPQLKK